MKINLFTQHLESSNKERDSEYQICREKNKNNNYIDNFITIKQNGYLKYNSFFKMTESYPDDINILANSDIFFDDSISICRNIRKNDCLAITRRELFIGPDYIEDSALTKIPSTMKTDTQDVWIFKGRVRKSVYGDISLGYPGCDNRIAWEIKNAGYKIMNPCEDIRIYHLHEEGRLACIGLGKNSTNNKRSEKHRIRGNYLFLPICRMIVKGKKTTYVLEK